MYMYIYMYMYICIYMYMYDVVKSKRRHWLAVTLSFTPCGDRQTDVYVYIYKVSSSIFVKKCSIHISRAEYKLLEEKNNE